MTRALLVVLAIQAGAAPAIADAPPAEAVLAELRFLDADVDAPTIRIDLAPVGSRPLPLVLDTGSPESFATPQAAQELGISLRRSKQTPYRRSTRLGRDVELWVDTRRSDTARSASGEWAVLGGRYLSSYVVEIDGPGRRVRFLDPARWTVPEKSTDPEAQTLPLRLVSNRPIVEIEVGAARVSAILTTSAPGTLLLPGGYAEEASLVPDPEATKTLVPMPGAGALRAATAPSVRIGRFETKDVPLLVAERGVQGAGPRSEAILGLELLRPYVLRIDYPRRRLSISRPSPPPDPRLP